MHRDYQLVAIFGQFYSGKVVICGRCRIARYHQASVSIVAARCAYSFHESLLILVYDIPRFGSACPLSALTAKSWLVQTLEYKVFVIALEAVSYLRPYSFQFFYILFFLRWLRLVPFFMMCVEYNEHAVIYAVVDYLLHPVHPCGVYLIIVTCYMTVPADRHAQYVETRLNQSVHHILIGLHLVGEPCSFGIKTVSARVHSVAEIPAVGHLCNEVNS